MEISSYMQKFDHLNEYQSVLIAMFYVKVAFMVNVSWLVYLVVHKYTQNGEPSKKRSEFVIKKKDDYKSLTRTHDEINLNKLLEDDDSDQIWLTPKANTSSMKVPCKDTKVLLTSKNNQFQVMNFKVNLSSLSNSLFASNETKSKIATALMERQSLI